MNDTFRCSSIFEGEVKKCFYTFLPNKLQEAYEDMWF